MTFPNVWGAPPPTQTSGCTPKMCVSPISDELLQSQTNNICHFSFQSIFKIHKSSSIFLRLKFENDSWISNVFSSSKFSKCFCIACLFRFTEETFLIRYTIFELKEPGEQNKIKIWKYFLFILLLFSFLRFLYPTVYHFFGTGRV